MVVNGKLNNVLHVDDDEGDTLLLQQACVKAKVSFALHSVENGEKAIAYLQGTEKYVNRERHPLPTLILLDLKMPRKNGFDVLGWIRGQDRFKSLPVIMFTASNQEEDIKRAYATGANSYLVKPVGINTLVEMMQLLDSFWFGMNQNPNV